MKLFRCSIRHKYDRNKNNTVYVVGITKESASHYVEKYLRDGYYIHKIVYLGDQDGNFFKR